MVLLGSKVEFPREGMLECIESGAFAGCRSLQRILIPSTVAMIGGQAFRDCSRMLEAVLRRVSNLWALKHFKDVNLSRVFISHPPSS